MATYAIGDIQGCFQTFQLLLKKLNFSTESDRLWLVGDVVNRGPKSLATLEYLYDIKDCVVITLGNHDLHLLTLWHGIGSPKSQDTLDGILKSSRCNELCHWLQQQSFLIEHDTLPYVMAHAGIAPLWSLRQARSHARELEQVLRGPQQQQYFQHMYGNEPAGWHDGLKGPERWRTLTNYFCRMRLALHTHRQSLNPKTLLLLEYSDERMERKESYYPQNSERLQFAHHR